LINVYTQFSNAVSTHLSVPNGMDPPEHTKFRRIVDSYFTAERILAFEPACRGVAIDLVGRLPKNGETELIAEFADVFAIEVQCAFLDWPASLHQPLLQWTRKNHAATRAGDKTAMDAVASEFDGYILGLLEERRRRNAGDNDAVSRLLRECVSGRPLSDEEIVSVLRTWTVGELSTISACVGIVVHYLANRQELQQAARTTMFAAAGHRRNIANPFAIHFQPSDHEGGGGHRRLPTTCGRTSHADVGLRQPGRRRVWRARRISSGS
jgi:cytochrome P450